MNSLAVNLGDITKIKTGKLDANASSEDGEYPFFTCAQKPLRISSYSYDCECVLIAGNGDLNVKYYEGKFDAYQRTYIVEVLPEKRNKLHLRYAYHFLETYLDTLREQSIGGIIKYIKMGNLTDAQIPLPPLAEQKRIAAILDAADALRAKRREALAQLDALLQSTFLTLFGDPVSNPMGWPVSRLGDVFDLKHGFAFKSEDFAEEGKYVLLTPGNFYEKGGFRDRGERQRYHDDPVPEDYILQKMDLLVAMTEQAPGLLGSPILVPESGKFLHNQRLGKLVKRAEVESLYVFELLNSHSIRARIQKDSTGTKVKHTSPTKITQIEIGIPPLPLQQNFAAIVESIERQKTAQRAHLAELDALFAALQHRAFRGEL